MRVVSLLPSATEIVASLGLGGALVGRSHECNWPPEVEGLPPVTVARLETEPLAGVEIDRAVRSAMAAGESLFSVDEQTIEALCPDVIITQHLCRICSVSDGYLRETGARVISLGPRTLAQVIESVRHLARELGVVARGEDVAGGMLERIAAVTAKVEGLRRPRVFLAEWLEPPFVCGHWLPEMVEAAGGEEVLGVAGHRSASTTWEAVRAAKPELVVAAPCGYDQARAAREAEGIDAGCPVVAVDAHRYFARPAPSLATGVEILAEIFHALPRREAC